MQSQQSIIDLLHKRSSVKKLVGPVPQGKVLNDILQAGLRAPDHGRLKPYRFVIIEGEKAFSEFHDLMMLTCDELNLNEKLREKAERMSTRAPMIIAVVSQVDSNNFKVPVWEQIVTAGCAVYGMQLAANAYGFDNFWATAKWVEGPSMRAAFGITNPDDKIVAFLLIGTAETEHRKPTEINVQEAKKLPQYVSYFGRRTATDLILD